MVAATTEKKPLSEKQQAHINQLHEDARARRAAAPAGEVESEPTSYDPTSPPDAISERQSFLARNGRLRSRTFEDASALTGIASGLPDEDEEPAPLILGQRRRRNHIPPGQISIEHDTDAKVKMWKKGPFGWACFRVPSHSLSANLQNGWLEYCPDCRTQNCDEDPNSCKAKEPRQYIVCPVRNSNGVACSKRIYSTGLMQDDDEQPHGEHELVGVYDKIDVRVELQAKMNKHIMTFHRDEGYTMGISGNTPLLPRMGMEIKMEGQEQPK